MTKIHILDSPPQKKKKIQIGLDLTVGSNNYYALNYYCTVTMHIYDIFQVLQEYSKHAFSNTLGYDLTFV